jgi:hypothetical protein
LFLTANKGNKIGTTVIEQAYCKYKAMLDYSDLNITAHYISAFDNDEDAATVYVQYS